MQAGKRQEQEGSTMTVDMLIQKLKTMPPGMVVMRPEYTGFGEIATVTEMEVVRRPEEVVVGTHMAAGPSLRVVMIN